MALDPDFHHDEEQPKLARALKARLKQPGPVPEERDRALRRAIYDHFARQCRAVADAESVISSRKIFRGAGWFVAAAASLAIVFWIASPFGSGPQATEPVAQSPAATGTDRADIDQNGVIDIRDAFMLAREIEQHQPSPSRGGGGAGADMNADGVVDSADVDRIAARAVALNMGGVGAGS